MRIKQKVTIVFLLVTLLVTLTGCGSGKSEEKAARELIDRMIAAAEGAVVTQTDSKLELVIRYGDEIINEDHKTVYESHNVYDKESYRVNSEIKCTSSDGLNVDTIFNMAEEQGILYCYVYEDWFGWIKYEACFPKEEMSRNFVSAMNLENAEILDFKTEEVQVDGEEVYMLSVALKNANIRELVFETGIKKAFFGREYTTVDLSDIEVKIDYYVEPETARVLKVDAQLEGMKNLIEELTLFKTKATVEEAYGGAQVSNCHLVYENISYEEIEVPMMSFEDKKSSVLVPQQDTTYTIKMLDSEVEIICPKGWMVREKSSDYLWLTSADGQINRRYFMIYGETQEEFLNNDIPLEIASVKDVDIYVADKQGPKMGEFDTYEISVKEGVISYAYAPIMNALLVIIVEDYTSSRLDKSLPEVLESVSWDK